MNQNQHRDSKRTQDPRGSRTRERDIGVVLLTVDEACLQLRISRWTLYRLIHRRALRTIKIGNRRLIPDAAVADLVRALEDQEPWS